MIGDLLALSSGSLPSGLEHGSGRCPPRGLSATATSPADSAQKWRSGAEQEPEVVPVTASGLVVERELLPAAEHVHDKDDPGRKTVPKPPQQVRPPHDGSLPSISLPESPAHRGCPAANGCATRGSSSAT